MATKALFIVICGLLVVQFSTANIVSPGVWIEAEQDAENSSIKPNVTTENANQDELIFAHVLYRHGARNIAKVYPNDPWSDEKYWPEGIGQLTNEGKNQQYKLGQYLHRRYKHLLGDKYSPAKVYIQSTDTDRTLMSAQANCAGMFPPQTKEERWNDNILWQPIPVHTIPHLMDFVLSGGKECAKYEAAYKDYVRESDDVQSIYKKYGDRFVYWSEMSGKNISSFANVNDLYDTLNIEKKTKGSIEPWAEEAIKPGGIMEYITKFSYAMYTNTKQLARLKGGFLIKDILDRFQQKINATLTPDRSLWLYAAHDYTISNVLNGFGVFKLHIPPYACSLHFELYKNCGNKHYIQLFYRKSEEEHPEPINIPGCGEKCPLDQFYDLYQEIIPGDFDTECRLS